MADSVNAEDNEFAVISSSSSSSSSCSSSGRGGRSSRDNDDDEVSWFDEDPSESSGLTISANDGDDEEHHYEVGETYDISWAGGSIEDATIVRSDSFGDDSGVVVFEGTSESGETVSVVWTPNFDLDGWYDDAVSSGYKPGVYNTDQDGCSDVDMSMMCFGGDVPIVTLNGQRPAAELQTGDRVQTVDNGFAEIRWIGKTVQAGIGAAAAVEFAPNTVGNQSQLILSQQHRIFHASHDSALYFGAPEALLPAKAFVGLDGVRLRPAPLQVYVHILLDSHELIFAGGARCETLFLGDMVGDITGETHENASFFPDLACQIRGGHVPSAHVGPARPMLTVKEAQMILRNGYQIPAPERLLLRC